MSGGIVASKLRYYSVVYRALAAHDFKVAMQYRLPTFLGMFALLTSRSSISSCGGRSPSTAEAPSAA